MRGISNRRYLNFPIAVILMQYTASPMCYKAGDNRNSLKIMRKNHSAIFAVRLWQNSLNIRYLLYKQTVISTDGARRNLELPSARFHRNPETPFYSSINKPFYKNGIHASPY